MPKMKQMYTREEIQKVLQWQLETVTLARARGMLDPTLAELERHQLWEIARQFEITLADSALTSTKPSDGIEDRPALDARLGAQKETTPGALG